MFVRSLTLGVAAVALTAGAASAADLFIPTTPEPVYVDEAGFNWEGLYVGAELGGFFYDDDDGTTPEDTFGVIGGVAGVNFIPVDPILLGVEIQGDYIWSEDADAGLLLALGRVGAVVTDQVLVYAAGGVGSIFGDGESEMVYALGGGVEFAVTDSISVRGEVLGLGAFDDTAFFGNDDEFFDAAKATVGVFYHF